MYGTPLPEKGGSDQNEELEWHKLGRPNRLIRNEDEALLAELGYKQQLNRAWSGLSSSGCSFSIMSVLAGCSPRTPPRWKQPPIAISWGWPIVSALILIISLSLAELVTIPDVGPRFSTGSPGKLGRPKWAWWTGWFSSSSG